MRSRISFFTLALVALSSTVTLGAPPAPVAGKVAAPTVAQHPATKGWGKWPASKRWGKWHPRRRAHRPNPWHVGHSARGYRMSWVSRGFRGKPSVELSVVNVEPGSWQYLEQNVRADRYRGKRVRLTCWMKTADVDDITFGVHVNSVSSPLSLSSEQVSGTTDWKQYDLIFDVPTDAIALSVTPGNLGSHGSFQVAGVKVDVLNPATAPQAVELANPPSSAQEAVKSYSYPGDTARVVHIWMLSRRGKFEEALTEAVWITDNPNTTKEERCTALAGVAYLALRLGRRDTATKALDQFDKASKTLNIDPGVVTEAARTRDALNQSASTESVPATVAPAVVPAPVPPSPAPPSTPEATADAGRWRNANGNDWTGASTSPRNLNFASGLSSWEKGADYSSAPDYVAGIRPRAYYGRTCAVLESRKRKPHGNAVLCQWVRADNYLGKRIRITAMMRLASPHATRGSLFAHLDTRNSYTYWDGSSGDLLATSQWSRRELIIDIPADGQGIIFGGSLAGRGTLLIANVRVDVVDKSMPLTPGGVTQ